MMKRLAAAFLIACFAATPALADQRGFSVTSFTRVRVEGPVTLVIETGRSPSANADGDRRAIDRLKVDASDGLLMVGVDRSNWTGEATSPSNGRAVLRIGTPSLEALSVIGAGDVKLDRVRGASFTLTLAGSGKAAIGSIDVDNLIVGINGAGDATLGGKARQGRIRSQGNGTIDAEALSIDDGDISLIGAGEIRLRANRSAKTMLKGSGRIVIDGSPACTGSRDGSGEVLCGGGEL